jgi:hypothetical protein
MVDALLEDEAVVLALLNVPDETFDAFKPVRFSPAVMAFTTPAPVLYTHMVLPAGTVTLAPG